ncbi:LacI family DNA-binding transcriptional regulator [Mycoplasmatota bacterium]|nr:LacI family DNA-binding transcriptional regulator [Mycoplasmatota bacterium]
MANIKNVAKKANVSVATVSRVINNKGYVNEETRKLVEDAIKELNYIPNEFARSLFKKVSKTIGVIFPHLSNSFYYNVLEGIEEIAFENGYKVMICNTHEDAERENEYIKQFVKYNIDGIIVASNSDLLSRYKELEIPLVTIDRIIDDSVPSVTSDNVNGGYQAAQKLISNGCKHLVHFRGPSILLMVQERSKGFQKCLKENTLSCDTVDLAFIDPEMILIRQYLESHPNIDGIFCDSDIIAANVIAELVRLNKKVPDDIQVIGFDNTLLAKSMTPKLTTISQKMFEIGREAIKSLNCLIEKEELTNKHKLIPVELIERDTTK